MSRGDFHPLRVSSVDRLCDDAAAVTFDVPDELAEAFRFSPGQSLTLRRRIDDREERRQYSICAAVGAAPRVGVRVVPDGMFSQWLVEQVRAGDEIEVQTPSGTFGPDPDLGGRHVLVAAGSGITPVLSIASSLLANPEADVTLLYGNRRASTVMFTDEVADLKDRFPARFEVIHVLSREPRDVELFSGRLDADRLRRILTALIPVPDVDGFWLCGPFAMIESARDVLRDLKRSGREGPPRAVLRRRHPATPGRARRGRRQCRSWGPVQPGHRDARRPHHRAEPAPRPPRPRLGAGDTRRPSVRLQGRRVRHVPSQGRHRRGATCAGTTRWRTTSWPRATCSPARASRSPDELALDYDA